MHFTGVFREERKAKGLSILPRELGKAAGEAYKALTDTQKQKYLDMAAKDKKRHRHFTSYDSTLIIPDTNKNLPHTRSLAEVMSKLFLY